MPQAKVGGHQQLDLDKRNSAYGTRLLTAADGRHRRCRQVANLRAAVAGVLALAGIAGTVWRGIAVTVAVIGAVWAIASTVVVSRVQQSLRASAAILEEQFDTWLFNLPWSQLGVKPYPVEDVNAYARKGQGAAHQFRDWYPAVDGLPDIFAVLICQRVNVVWDMRLRRRFKVCLGTVAFVWLCLGFGGALIVGASVRSLVWHWLIPSAAGLAFVAENVFVQREAIADRDALMEVIRSVVEIPSAPASIARERRARAVGRFIQDRLLITRMKVDRVPLILYTHYHDRDREDMEAAARELRSLFVP